MRFPPAPLTLAHVSLTQPWLLLLRANLEAFFIIKAKYDNQIFAHAIFFIITGFFTCQWFMIDDSLSSRLSVAAPGDRKNMSIKGVWDFNCCAHSLLLASSLAGIKRGAPRTTVGQRCMFPTFATGVFLLNEV